jgi:hypothetical protein
LHIRENELLKGLASFLTGDVSNVAPLIKEVDDKCVYILNNSVHLQIVKYSDILSIIL